MCLRLYLFCYLDIYRNSIPKEPLNKYKHKYFSVIPECFYRESLQYYAEIPDKSIRE